MFFSYSFHTVFVALALITAAGPAVARPAGPPKGPPPRKITAANKAGQTARPARSIAAMPLAASAAPVAPQVVQLCGVVLNLDGRPCAGASVYPAGMARQLVVTDAQGAFVLPVPAGTALSLQVEYFGVGSSRVVVDVPSAEPMRITLGR